MKWLKRLFGLTDPETLTVQIDPDPDMHPGDWTWGCYDCGASGTGEAQEIRAESMTHCLQTGHSVYGNAL